MASVHLISDNEFDKWTLAWAALEESQDPFTFFKSDGRLQVGVTLDSESASYLLSTMGISTIKMRFGFWKDDQGTPRFEFILFGVDQYETRITPYYNPQQKEFKVIPEGGNGNLPDELAEQWRLHWETKGQNDEINGDMFRTLYGFLKGYNYPVREFMRALMPAAKTSDINIAFGLHRYFGLPDNPETAEGREKFTFGLMFYVPVLGTGAIETESGFFDLTAPCPRTC